MKGRGAYEQNRPSGRRAPRERPIHLDPRFDMELLELILRAMEWTGSAFICACKRSNQETIKNDVHMKPVSVLTLTHKQIRRRRLSTFWKASDLRLPKQPGTYAEHDIHHELFDSRTL